MMNDRLHWSLEAMADFLDEALPSSDHARLVAHLDSGCRTCADQLDWLKRVSATTQGENLVDPPPWVMQRAIRLFNQVNEDAGPGLIEKIVAKLVFDSRSLGPVPAVRTAVLGAERRLLFSAGDVEIDVQVQKGDSFADRRLIGQVMARSSERRDAYEIDLYHGRRRLIGRRTTPTGEFTFVHLRPGDYQLRVRVGRREIEVPNISL